MLDRHPSFNLSLWHVRSSDCMGPMCYSVILFTLLFLVELYFMVSDSIVISVGTFTGVATGKRAICNMNFGGEGNSG